MDCLAKILCAGLILHATLHGAFEQEPQSTQPAIKYKLAIVEDASKFRRTAKGRASSETVVKVTDENDKPVAGIVVSFSIPQFIGASFAGGAATATTTTTAAGLAAATVNVTTATASFSIGVSATVNGVALSATVPVSAAAATAAAAGGAGGAAAGAGAGGAGAGISGATIGIIVGVVAAGAIGGLCGSGHCGGSKPTPGGCGTAGQPACPVQGVGISLGIGAIFGPK